MALKNKIRILHTIRQGSFGGGETYLYNLARGLDPNTFESVIVAFTDGAMISRLRQEGFKAYVMPPPFPSRPVGFWSLKDIIAKERINLVHAHGTRGGLNALPAAKLAGVPGIYTVHGWSFHPGTTGTSDSIRVMVERLVTGMADFTVCVSEANLAEGVERVGNRNYRVIRNGITTQDYDPEKVQPLNKKYYGFEEDDFVIGSIARLTYQKDPLTLIRAFAKVLPVIPRARLLFVGKGEMEEPARALVKQLHIDQYVNFAPFTSYVAQALMQVDVFVLPSLWEGLSLSLMEAMCMKKASIATSITANRELLQHGYNGMLFGMGDHEQLAQSIIKIANEERFKTLIENNARETVLRNFGFERVVRDNQLLYMEVMKNHRGTAGY